MTASANSIIVNSFLDADEKNRSAGWVLCKAYADENLSKEKKDFESVQNELKDLAGRQEKIGKVTKDIATGKSEANPK
ncbi:MAG: hypothetical protein EBV06_05630 [Planctomycetia bacterium]|nr:hypothetical protein [Planctomycetia bacterium]